MTISDSESIVMAVLWENSSATADAVIDAISDQQDWSAATVKTLLNRLLKKGAISATRDGRRYVYSATVTRDEYVTKKSRSLIDRLFGGRIAPLVSHFSEQKQLTENDIIEIKQLIDKLEDDR